jgi:hypothetical protein
LLLSILLALAACLSCGAAVAQAPKVPVPTMDAGGPAWGSLTAQQRSVLAPLQRDWVRIDASGKAKWLEMAVRFPSLPAAEQQRVQVRMAEWARLTPAERGRARMSFQETKQLSVEQKQQRWEAYQALPDEERKALAARAKPADDKARVATRPATPLDAAQPKQTASAPRAGARTVLVKPVAPSIVQAKPGATTTLMTKPAAPPAHQTPGQPKIAAKPGQVDRRTLLPQSGPQAAASAPRQP